MVGIVGMGYVGSAVYAGLKHPDSALINDKYKTLRHNTSIKKMRTDCDVIFVCVSTPSMEDGGVAFNNLHSVLEDLRGYKGVVVVKSTIPHKYLEQYDNIVYNPEFLNENSHIEDFQNQDYIVLGGSTEMTMIIEDIYSRKFNIGDNVKFEHCSIKEASNFKYIRNIYSAYKVLFWNYVHEQTGNSRKMAKMMKNIPLGENDIVGMDGEMGFGGACLKKDLMAFDFEKGHELTHFMVKYNYKLQNPGKM